MYRPSFRRMLAVFPFKQSYSQKNYQTMSYCSIPDTLKHIKRVSFLLGNVAIELIKRSQKHDDSKLVEPEKGYYDLLDPEFRKMKYGGPEYHARRALAMPGIELHHKNNSHHPEHHADGVNDMTLFDIIEMLCDWKAATERNPNGDFRQAFEYNIKTFKIDDQLEGILLKTAYDMGFL